MITVQGESFFSNYPSQPFAEDGIEKFTFKNAFNSALKKASEKILQRDGVKSNRGCFDNLQTIYLLF